MPVIRALKLMLPAVVAVLMSGVGCTQSLNDRPTLGGRYISPTLDPTEAPIARSGDALFVSRVDATRTGWAPTQFIVPFDGSVHAQTLRITPPLRKDSSARAYGRYPSKADVLDPQSHTWFEELFFTGSELGRSIIGTPLAIGILAWQGELDRPAVSPSAYKRTPQTAWSSGTPDKPKAQSVQSERGNQ